MKTNKRKSNKIPRTRLPSLQKHQPSLPKVRFFHKIKNSFNLLEQPNFNKNSRHDSPQQKKPIQSLTQYRKKFISSRIQRLAMPKPDFLNSFAASTEKQNHFNCKRQNQGIFYSKSQKTSRVNNIRNFSSTNTQSQQDISQPQNISSKPLGDLSFDLYKKLSNDSPLKNSLIRFQTGSNKDQHELQNEEQTPLATPLLLNGLVSLATSIKQKMGKGKQTYLYNQIMGEGPYHNKYQQFHRKLVEKDKIYQSKKFRMNHKNDWRT